VDPTRWSVCAAEKNNGQINSTLTNAFNDSIQQLGISELDLSDRLYTWSNKQPNPIDPRQARSGVFQQ